MRAEVRRTATLVVAVTGILLLLAAPAAAHGRGSDATNFRSRVTDAPDLPGVTWRVYGGDELLQVTNDGPAELLVEGYEGEPYLRVGPDGVFENRRSPAAYLNQDRLAMVSLPDEADAEAEPDWVRVSTGRSASWHDHRIHWMAPTLPDAVEQAGTDTETVVFDAWEVPFTLDGRPYTVVGELRWIPPGSPWGWLAAGLVLALPALAGLRTDPVGAGEAGQQRWPGAARPAAAVLGLVVLLNTTHLVDDFLAVPMPGSLIAVAAGQTLLFLAIGAFGVVRGWQAEEGAFTALGVGAGAMLIGQGLLYWSALTASQVATVFPDAVARLAVGLSIAQIVPLGIVVVIGTRRLLPPLEAVGATDEPAGAGA
jgi:hypothetical protein